MCAKSLRDLNTFCEDEGKCIGPFFCTWCTMLSCSVVACSCCNVASTVNNNNWISVVPYGRDFRGAGSCWKWLECGQSQSSVQFSSPRLVWCWVQALQDHDTVINVIHAVVTGTEMFSGVSGRKRGTARRWHWVATHCMPMFLRPEMCSRQVKTGVWQKPGRRYWRPNAVRGGNESQTWAWNPLRSTVL